MCIYIYIHSVYVHIYTYIYIYTFYVYIYIYIHGDESKQYQIFGLSTSTTTNYFGVHQGTRLLSQKSGTSPGRRMIQSPVHSQKSETDWWLMWILSLPETNETSWMVQWLCYNHWPQVTQQDDEPGVAWCFRESQQHSSRRRPAWENLHHPYVWNICNHM